MSIQSVKTTPKNAIWIGVAVIFAVLVGFAEFRGALLELVNRWMKQEEYSHGFLIPVVVGWLLWTRREALLASFGRPAWAGLALILLAMALHITGELSAIFILSQIGFVVALLGIVLGVGGYSLFKVTFVPIVFLLFAIPLPYFIDANLSFSLQLISSQLGVFIIKLFQIPVYLEGNVIDLGYYKLQVVDACSGLRYLFPLLSLGFLAAYMFHAPIWQRALVFLSTIPITIFMNGFRIGLIGVTVDRWGTQMAEGVLHLFEGWVIFLACAILLAGEMYVLARLSGRRFFEAFYVPTVSVRPAQAPEVGGWMRLTPLVACLSVLCVAGLAVSLISVRSEIIPARTRFVAFPTNLGQWQGRASNVEPWVETALAADDYILSDYSRGDGKAVNLWVTYYSSQRKGESPHSPLVCIPGNGWQITRIERASLVNAGAQQSINRVIVQKDATKEVVYYWYEERGRKIASEYWSKWYLLSDSIIKNRSDGALVRLISQVYPGEVEADADERLRAFVQNLEPRLSEFLPGDTSPGIQSAQYEPKGN